MLPLSPIDAKDLAVDRCPLCEGFWLDSGELEKMQDVADIPDQEGSLDVIHDQRPSDWSHLRWIIYCIKKIKLERSSLSP
jgi:Zn-finger nucleic acid-binding protein